MTPRQRWLTPTQAARILGRTDEAGRRWIIRRVQAAEKMPGVGRVMQVRPTKGGGCSLVLTLAGLRRACPDLFAGPDQLPPVIQDAREEDQAKIRKISIEFAGMRMALKKAIGRITALEAAHAKWEADRQKHSGELASFDAGSLLPKSSIVSHCCAHAPAVTLGQSRSKHGHAFPHTYESNVMASTRKQPTREVELAALIAKQKWDMTSSRPRRARVREEGRGDPTRLELGDGGSMRAVVGSGD